MADCEERERLRREVLKAKANLEIARKRVRARIGVSPKEEFALLRHALNQSREDVQRAQLGLDRHIADHACGE